MTQSISAPSLRGRLRQKASHSRLRQDVSMTPVPSRTSRRARLDAMIVPAWRPASAFDGLIALSAHLDCPLVLLCSGQADIERLAERVAKSSGARALLIDVPADYRHPAVPKRTSREQFGAVGGDRKSDLSLKRNLGLLVARLHGWQKIVFIDDDITFPRPDGLVRMAGHLENHQIAGMACREFPDNSVVCHARRLAGFAQDNFVSGAVLGVHCGDVPLPFFPDIYNEDWFFFSQAVARRDLLQVGNALQAEYDPFASPTRARHEEFGDLIAEGLFSLFEDAGPDMMFSRLLKAASARYWSDFREVRYESLDETDSRLGHYMYEEADDVARARQSLGAAREQLELITPQHCVEFIDAWRSDLNEWAASCAGMSNVGSTRTAMDELGIARWRIARPGHPDVRYHSSFSADR